MQRGADVTLADLQAHDDGPDLSPYDISRLTAGKLSDDKIRADIDRGILKARVIPCGTRTWRRVPFLSARAYLRARNYLCATCQAVDTAKTAVALPR